MSDISRKTGTDDIEAFEGIVEPKPTPFQEALEKRISARKPPVRGKQIKVLDQTSGAEDAEMTARIEALHKELAALKPEERKSRMDRVGQEEPDLFEAIGRRRLANRAKYETAMSELEEIRAVGTEIRGTVQGALTDVTSGAVQSLSALANSAESEEFTPPPSSDVRPILQEKKDRTGS